MNDLNMDENVRRLALETQGQGAMAGDSFLSRVVADWNDRHARFPSFGLRPGSVSADPPVTEPEPTPEPIPPAAPALSAASPVLYPYIQAQPRSISEACAEVAAHRAENAAMATGLKPTEGFRFVKPGPTYAKSNREPQANFSHLLPRESR